MEVKIRHIVQAGANEWRKVLGVKMNRKISRKLKGNVLDSYVVGIYLLLGDGRYFRTATT